jgi:hypothetical protein
LHVELRITLRASGQNFVVCRKFSLAKDLDLPVTFFRYGHGLVQRQHRFRLFFLPLLRTCRPAPDHEEANKQTKTGNFQHVAPEGKRLQSAIFRAKKTVSIRRN